MSRPQIIVNVKPALARRGTATETGTAFLVYAGAAGPLTPTRCYSEADALAALVPPAVASWVGDLLGEGAPEVVVLRAAAVAPAAVTESEWSTALGLLSDEFGPGQVLIPGVATPAAHAALLDHAALTNRCVLLDGEVDATASELTALAAGLAAADGATQAGLVAPWVTAAGAGGTTRQIPGSVAGAALAARGDGVVGHANHQPANDQGRGAGVVRRGTGVTASFSTTEQDALADAGVSVIVKRQGLVTLTNWRSISDDDRFRQLNVGRFTMELGVGFQGIAYPFLSRPIDGKGLLFAEFEGALRGYLLGKFSQNALYGENADDAFDVVVADVNTPATIAARELRAAVEASLTPSTESIVIDVVTTIAEGA